MQNTYLNPHTSHIRPIILSQTYKEIEEQKD